MTRRLGDSEAQNQNLQRGAALLIALGTATAVFLIAGAVLSIVMQRFEMAGSHADRQTAFYASEGAIRYAFSRLKTDAPSNGVCEGDLEGSLRDKIRVCNTNPYLITSWRAPVNPVIDGAAATPHERTDDLFFGSPCPDPARRQGHETTVRIRWIEAESRYEVRGFAEPAQGCQ